jgi:gliding motility-associated-like protein
VTIGDTITRASIDTQVACDSYTWIDGVTYTASNNNATFTETNVAGCDSVITLDLTINNTQRDTMVVTSCDSYAWLSNGQSYMASGFYSDTTNVNGCDSITSIELTINLSTTGTDTQVACDSYTWIDGNTYTASNNSATFTLQNANNCDSVVTLDLTINLSTTGTDTQVACDSYTWIDGITYTASNNSATFTRQNANNCDSVVTLDLTINLSTTGTDTQVACDSYIWIDGNTYTASNNSATFILQNANNCDSVVTLDLTINLSTTGTDTQVACDSYTWIDGNTYTASNNSATFTLQNANNCDSVVTLDLTINNTLRDTTAIAACDSYLWSANSQMYMMSGIYSDTTQVNGCDSISSIDLTIDSSTVANAGNDETKCEIEVAMLSANTPTNGIGSWTVLAGSGSFINSSNASTSVSGMSQGPNQFIWSITNGVCPISADTVTITKANNPIVDAGADQTIFKDDRAVLQGTSDFDGQEDVIYSWEPAFFLAPSNVRVAETNSFLETTTEFSLDVTSPDGCTGRDSLLVTVNETVTFSSGFTPNGDGTNDLWQIKNIQDPSISSHEVTIYNSFGSQLFNTNNFQGWDGTFGGSLLPVSSYYYTVKLNFLNGESRVETGVVTLLR